MTLIDTSAWVEFFRRKGHVSVKERVHGLIGRGEAAYSCPVYFELLSGAREAEVEIAEKILGFCTRIKFEPAHWDLAAKTDRGLRQRGVTVNRGDLFIAAVASASNLPLLCRDKHFDLIRDQGGLKIDVEQIG